MPRTFLWIFPRVLWIPRVILCIFRNPLMVIWHIFHFLIYFWLTSYVNIKNLLNSTFWEATYPLILVTTCRKYSSQLYIFTTCMLVIISSNNFTLRIVNGIILALILDRENESKTCPINRNCMSNVISIIQINTGLALKYIQSNIFWRNLCVYHDGDPLCSDSYLKIWIHIQNRDFHFPFISINSL